MKIEFDEGTLAAQVRSLGLIEPELIWQRVQRLQERRAPAAQRRLQFRRRHRLTLALIAALALVLLGGTAMAVGLLTRPAFVHGKPVTQSPQGGFAAHMGWPGHPIPVSVDEGGQLAGFKVLTLDPTSGATLNSLTYVPKVVPANQPAPTGGGSVSLDYTIDGTEVQINEGLDPNPAAPLDVNQKILPGHTGSLCASVETIDGGQYIVVRCPDGTTIVNVLWKTLDGVDISLVPVLPPSTPKGSPPAALSMTLVRDVIEHLR